MDFKDLEEKYGAKKEIVPITIKITVLYAIIIGISIVTLTLLNAISPAF